MSTHRKPEGGKKIKEKQQKNHKQKPNRKCQFVKCSIKVNVINQ